jgi:hypothetical protein
VKSIVVTSTDSFRHGKTALATGLTSADTYRDGEQWQSAKDLPHNTYVSEVNHFGRHTTTKGEVMLVESLLGEPSVKVEVIDIRAVDPERLTSADFQALGYTDKAEYMGDWGEVFGSRIWLLHIRPLS